MALTEAFFGAHGAARQPLAVKSDLILDHPWQTNFRWKLAIVVV